MIDKSQEECLFEVLRLFQELDLNKHVVLIGSWVEYFYDAFFPEDFNPEIATRDIDFLYRNIRLPEQKIPIVKSLREHGFIYDEHPLTKVAKFYKSNIIEIEFLTKVIGQDQITYHINSLGIIAEGLRELNLLDKHCIEVSKNGITCFIPQPSAFVVHKILINEKRKKQNKDLKDLRSIKNILKHIERDSYQRRLLKSIIFELSEKERKKFSMICQRNNLVLPMDEDH